MAEISYAQEILEAVEKLDAEQQRKVLEYAQSLGRPEGMTGKEFVAHTRAIKFPKEDLAEIAEAIKDLDVIDPEKDINLDG